LTKFLYGTKLFTGIDNSIYYPLDQTVLNFKIIFYKLTAVKKD